MSLEHETKRFFLCPKWETEPQAGGRKGRPEQTPLCRPEWGDLAEKQTERAQKRLTSLSHSSGRENSVFMLEEVLSAGSIVSAGRKGDAAIQRNLGKARSRRRRSWRGRHWQETGAAGGKEQGGQGGRQHTGLWALIVFSLARLLCLPWRANLSLWGF